MHDCEITQEKLIDLIFDEVASADFDSLRAEIDQCENCRQEYLSMIRTMQVFDQAIEAASPVEAYWPQYENRLRERLAQDASRGPWRRFLEGMSGLIPQTIQARAVLALVLLTLALLGFYRFGGGNRTQTPDTLARTRVPNATPSPERAEATPTPAVAPPSQNQLRNRPVQKPRKPAPHSPEPGAAKEQPSINPTVNLSINDELAAVGVDAAPSYFTPETVRHFEKAQILLRSFRNADVRSASIDLDYEKRLSRKLVFQNILLRRDAEAKGIAPVQEALGELEPILLDIANLPEKVTQDEVRSIRERIARQEMVASLQTYASPVRGL